MRSRPPASKTAQHAPLQSTVQPVLVTAGLLLMLNWLGAWAFDWERTLVLAATLVLVIVSLLAVVARLFINNTDTTGAAMPLRGVEAGSAHFGQSPAQHDSMPSLHGKRWTLDVFAHIDAQRFAAVCETWFSWAGFDTRPESHRTQEGVDIWLHASRLPGPVAIVRCKHAPDKPIGLQELREFRDVVSTCKHAHGTFTTTSTYTPEALQFARENGIEVVDGRALLRRILTRTRQSQQALLTVAYHGR